MSTDHAVRSHPGTIAAQLGAVRERIERACDRAGRDPASVTLVAVSKGQPIEAIRAAIDAGATDFGENRVQEALPKLDALAGTVGVRFHLIGHLQSNKVRDVLGRFAILQAIDSGRLLQAVAAQAREPETCMLQVNVAGDSAKFGVAPGDVAGALLLARSLPGTRVSGLMTVPPRVADPELARPHFRALRALAEQHHLSLLSMGMTEDFEVAIEEGATHVRVGRAIFGERPV